MLLALLLVSSAFGVSLIGLALQRATVSRARAEAAAARADLDRLRDAAPPAHRSVRAMKAVVGTAVQGASRLREGGVTGLLMSSIDDLTRWAAEDRSAIARMVGGDGAMTILFSDIEDSTALNARIGDDGWMRLLTAHDKVVQTAVDRHRGHIVKSQGDGFMIVFSHPDEAVRAGIEIQDALAAPAPRTLRKVPIRVRVGIHCGTAIAKDGDFFGHNVAKAARVAALGKGGQILVSDEVRQGLRGVEDILLVDFRESELKGLPGTHRLWEVSIL